MAAKQIRGNQQKQWIICDSVPNSEIYSTLHQGIEEGEFMVIQGALSYNYNKSCTIYIFNTKIQKWNKYNNCPQNIATQHIAVLDPERQTLYVLENSGFCQVTLLKIDIQNQTHECMELSGNIGTRDHCLVINNTLHVFGKRHMILNNDRNEFVQQSSIPENVNVTSGCVYIPSQKRMWMIGGLTTDIYCYSFIDKSWTKLHLKLPIALKYCSCSVIDNGRYIILFGGFRQFGPFVKNEEIFILDTLMMVIKQSKVCTPSSVDGFCQTIIPENKLRGNVSCHGFVRDIWNDDKFKDLQYPPFYLNELIAEYYSNDDIYLIYKTNCFKIKVDTLFEYE